MFDLFFVVVGFQNKMHAQIQRGGGPENSNFLNSHCKVMENRPQTLTGKHTYLSGKIFRDLCMR